VDQGCVIRQLWQVDADVEDGAADGGCGKQRCHPCIADGVAVADGRDAPGQLERLYRDASGAHWHVG